MENSNASAKAPSEQAAEQLQAAVTCLTTAINTQLNTIRTLEQECARLQAQVNSAVEEIGRLRAEENRKPADVDSEETLP